MMITIFIFVGCSSNNHDDDPDFDKGITDDFGYYLIDEFEGNGSTVELYSKNENLEEGYNPMAIRILDQSTGKYVSGAEPIWYPEMDMIQHKHSAPHSTLTTPNHKTLYEGYMMFVMPSMSSTCSKGGMAMDSGDMDWFLDIEYALDGKKIKLTHQQICVANQNEDKLINYIRFSPEGVDGTFFMALIEPNPGVVGGNDMTVALHSSNNTNFGIVKNYKVEIDPRMPEKSMGNHSSPNNKHLEYDPQNKLYKGRVNFTMNGYWVLNLKVYDDKGNLVGGTDVTHTAIGKGDENVPAVDAEDYDPNAEGAKSTLFFEVDFL